MRKAGENRGVQVGPSLAVSSSMASEMTPEEFEALRTAMGRPRKAPGPMPATDPDADASPVALIDDDQKAEKAKPDADRILKRWVRSVPVVVQRMCKTTVEVGLPTIEIIEGSVVKAMLENAWCRVIHVRSISDSAIVLVEGPMVEGLSVRMLGADLSENDEQERPPSPVARQLFTRMGVALANALVHAWREEQSCWVELNEEPDVADEWPRGLADDDLVLHAELDVSGETRGKITLICRPETAVLRPPPASTTPVAPGAVEAALGAVPIEVDVELGRTKMSLKSFSKLSEGSVLLLDRFLHDPLPLRVAGKIKGQAKPMASNGSLVVEILQDKEMN